MRILLLLPLVLAGCVSWQPARRPESALEQIRTRPQALRVTLKDQSVITYRVPVVRGDSIFEGDAQFGTGRTVAIADVARTETRHVSGGRVVLVGIGAFVLSVVLLLALVPWY